MPTKKRKAPPAKKKSLIKVNQEERQKEGLDSPIVGIGASAGGLETLVVMPKMGGKEVAERLQPLYPQMKVIYMSGYTDDAIAQHGVLAPGLNFFEKPFVPERLARKVREILNAE